MSSPHPPLLTSEPGSFASLTMRTRLPAVIRAVHDTNLEKYSADILADLNKFAEEVETGCPLRAPLQDDDSWTKVYQPYHQRGWLDMPWFEAEAYLYHCILNITHYYDPTSPFFHYDPFAPQKQEELDKDRTWSLVRSGLSWSGEKSPRDAILALLLLAIYGNKADLCYKQVVNTMDSDHSSDQKRPDAAPSLSFNWDSLLVNDGDAVVDWLLGRAPLPVVSVIVDNSGAELLCDLVLVDYLLNHQLATKVILHTKAAPTFVSDVTPADMTVTLQHMRNFPENDVCHQLGGRLTAYLSNHKMEVQPHEFWNSAAFFDQVPDLLCACLAAASLIVVKGDANYRRILLDHRWPVATSFDSVMQLTNLPPVSLVSLRTLKSDPIVGLGEGQDAELDAIDANWRVNGARAVIQARLIQ